MPKKNKANDLLKAISQRGSGSSPKPTTSSPSSRKPELRERKEVSPPPRPSSRARGARGKAIQFYLHAEDEKLIREYAVWLSPHRKRINDSLIIKAALRVARTGPGFLAAYDEGLAISEAHKGNRYRSEDQ